MAQLRKARRAPACVVGEPGAAAGDVAEAEHVLIPRRDREGRNRKAVKERKAQSGVAIASESRVGRRPPGAAKYSVSRSPLTLQQQPIKHLVKFSTPLWQSKCGGCQSSAIRA